MYTPRKKLGIGEILLRQKPSLLSKKSEENIFHLFY